MQWDALVRIDSESVCHLLDIMIIIMSESKLQAAYVVCGKVMFSVVSICPRGGASE